MLPEYQRIRIGQKIAKIFKLRMAKGYNKNDAGYDRYVTEWGTKSALGVYNTLHRLINV